MQSIMDQPQTDLPSYPLNKPPSVSDGVMMHGADEAPPWHGASDGARAVSLEEFSLTRDQVATMYAAAGIDVMPSTVSRYAKEGILRATMVDAERGLKRYLYSQSSVEDDIERRLRGPEPIYAPTNEQDVSDDATMQGTDDARSRHDASDGAGTMPRQQASSLRGDRVRELEIENATLRGRLRENEEQRERDREALKNAWTENGKLQLAGSHYQTRAEELEKRLALLEAPRAVEPEPPTTAKPPATPKRRSLWARITGKH
jgi:hypothetical protein